MKRLVKLPRGMEKTSPWDCTSRANLYCRLAMKRASKIFTFAPRVLLTSALAVSCREYTCADTADCPIEDAGAATGAVEAPSTTFPSAQSTVSSVGESSSPSDGPAPEGPNDRTSGATATSELSVSIGQSDASVASGTDAAEESTALNTEGQNPATGRRTIGGQDARVSH